MAARRVAMDGRAADRLDQAVPAKDGMNGAPGGNSHIAGQAPDQKFADLARSPMRLLPLEGEDQAFHLGRQLVGVAQPPARPVGQRLKPIAAPGYLRWQATNCPGRASRSAGASCRHRSTA